MSARAQHGFTLVELLTAMALFSVVMLAAFKTLDVFIGETANADRRSATHQESRAAVTQISRQLRNLASPTPGRPEAVDKATDYDLVFQTVDPAGPNSGANRANVRRVRYCLSSQQPDNGTIWQQIQTWTQAATPAAPSSGACPDADASWTSSRIVATHVVNRIGGQERPVWQYDALAPVDITAVRTTLVFDLRPGSAPGETTLSTGVFLRNQNRAPIASFTATAAGLRHVLLNGSLSVDPEGEPLTYTWYDGTTMIGSGVTLDYVAPAVGTRSLTLKVVDPGGLEDEAPAEAVFVL